MSHAHLRSARTERRLDAAVSYTLLVLSTLFALFPVAWMLSTSLKSEAEAFRIPVRWIPQHPTLSAYVEMWTLKPFGLYFWNSLVVSGVTALLSTAVGALAGYGFSRFQFRGRTGLIIAYVTICLPFAAWMSKGYFDSIPKELDEAGLVDGASRFQIFLRIIMPIAVPGTVATLLFGFLLAWQDLLWALCLISIDAKRTVTLGVAFTVGEFMVKWPMLTAASLIGSLPTIILYLFLQRFYVEGLARGAVKG